MPIVMYEISEVKISITIEKVVEKLGMVFVNVEMKIKIMIYSHPYMKTNIFKINGNELFTNVSLKKK